MLKTFQYRIYPTPSQCKLMESTIETCRRFYNACLAERKEAYEQHGESIGKFAQLRKVKEEKANNPYAANIHSHVLQVVVADLDKAFQAFFRRVKSGETPGYPRFKGRNRFDSFGYKEYGNGFKLDGRRLKLSGIGRVAVRWHRPIEGNIKNLRIRYKAGAWYACFACEMDTQPLPKTGQAVGVDVGISSLLATSDGELIANPKWYRAGQAKLRVLQRRVSRRKKGGSNRRKAVFALQCHHEHISNQRKDYLNKAAAYLICRYDLIAVENLRIGNMAKNHTLAKSILDGGWGYLVQQLTHKAVEADRQLVLVNPAYTSKSCSACGAIFEDLSLSDRWVTCDCGLSLDRDINAAINILKRALERDGQSLWEPTWAAAPCVSQEAPAL
ncbi:MAG: RNA-guided endonuclease InsQ/TnpB family protein [Bacteroidales bacterium]